jgi:hypothetical protein
MAEALSTFMGSTTNVAARPTVARVAMINRAGLALCAMRTAKKRADRRGLIGTDNFKNSPELSD